MTRLRADCQETGSAPCPTLVIKYGTTYDCGSIGHGTSIWLKFVNAISAGKKRFIQFIHQQDANFLHACLCGCNKHESNSTFTTDDAKDGTLISPVISLHSAPGNTMQWLCSVGW